MAPGRAVAAVLALAALAGGACSGDGDGGTTEEPTPVSSDKTVPTPTTAIDVSTIPAKIDEPYINAVLAALDQVNGEAMRLIVESKQLVPDAASHLAAIYDQDEFNQQVELWLQQVQKGFEGFKSSPGAPRSTVVRTMSASRECISIEITEDASAFLVTPGRYTNEFVQLVPLDPSRNKLGLNRTAWMIHRAGLPPAGSAPTDPCAD